MGRKLHPSPLAIWTNGQLVGHWTPSGRRPAELEYEPSWVQSTSGRPLSLSLPFPIIGNEPLKGPVVENFFENLLPDSDVIRRRLAARFTEGSEDAFDLLAALGRDCVGAIQLLPPDQPPDGYDRIEGVSLAPEDIANLLRGTVSTSDHGRRDDKDDFRISIAGAQEKTALLWHEGRWMRPQGATPTTHIIKMPLGLIGNMRRDMSTSVHNEWLCLKLLRAFGIPVANASIETFADHPPVLVVERFDRRLHQSGRWIVRLPQEDFCQALGVSPFKKYEADGGPGVATLARILHASQNARADLKTLLASQILFWLLAATDGHAKNFSIRLLAGGRFELTSLYDVLSAWPIIGETGNLLSIHKAKLAMAISGKSRHYELNSVKRRHFNATAARCGWGENCEDIITEVLANVESAIESASSQIPPGFPDDVARAITDGLRSQATKLRAQQAT
ncbi:MAG: type II toxin-antitoxin system HipA family toxin [Ramlibacter sp.]